METVSKRQANVYVFCLLDNKDRGSVNPMDIEQWAFDVVPTKKLDKEMGKRGRISVVDLKRLKVEPTRYSDLSEAVHRAAGRMAAP